MTANEASDGVSLREQIKYILQWLLDEVSEDMQKKRFLPKGEYIILDDDEPINRILDLIHHHDQRIIAEARKQAASDIFNLAHEYAQQDKTMLSSEDLRGYHYFNAIHEIGEFDGR